MFEPEKKDILAEKDWGVGAARNVLARLFRQVLRDLGIEHQMWHRLMLRYLNDKRNNIPPNGKDRSSARGNLNKELRRDRMTWKVFNDKAIPFLNPIKVRFVLEMTWANNKTTRHELNMSREALMADDNSEDDNGEE